MERTRQLMIEKLGTLMFANTELGAANEHLLKELGKANAEIKRLSELLAEKLTTNQHAVIEGEVVKTNGATP